MSDRQTPLVMIHGLLGSLDYFNPAEMFDNRAVHAPCLLGYGSSAVDFPLSLRGQAEFVAQYIAEKVGEACWLVGHSVGGAIAMVAAGIAPQAVASVIRVEGNFTLGDAFWCAKIAAMREDDWRVEYAATQADPAAWLAQSGVEVSPVRLRWADAILKQQSAATVQAMARAVVIETGAPAYLQGVGTVVERGLPIHLLAGERSASDWHVPEWLMRSARSYVVLRGTGHMLMLEQPQAFCGAVEAMLRTP